MHSKRKSKFEAKPLFTHTRAAKEWDMTILQFYDCHPYDKANMVAYVIATGIIEEIQQADAAKAR